MSLGTIYLLNNRQEYGSFHYTKILIKSSGQGKRLNGRGNSYIHSTNKNDYWLNCKNSWPWITLI